MKFSIRTALSTVAVLGVATCVLALYALARPLAVSARGRYERARLSVEDEVRRLQVMKPDPVGTPSAPGLAMPSGFVLQGDSFETLRIPWPEAPSALRDVLAQSQRTHDVVSDHESADAGVLFVAAAPTSDPTRYAWAAYATSPGRWTPVLRMVGVTLTAVALALALAALYAVFSVRRGAAALTRCLAALGRDLSTPVPQSNVRELSGVADGIANLAKELSNAQRELAERERLAVLGRVTAGVAHEIRNPLATIKLRIDLLRRNSALPEDVTRELGDVGGEVMRLDRLVNDLLTVAGKRLGEQRDEDLGTLARRRVELLQPLAAAKQLDISVVGTAHSKVDSDAMSRLVDNLLKNAIEASPPGGTIRVDVASAADGITLQCRDHGDGVPSSRSDELFEPFFTTKPEGVGLGLALSRAIAVAHGGNLVYRRDGTSTVFELKLAGVAS